MPIPCAATIGTRLRQGSSMEPTTTPPSCKSSASSGLVSKALSISFGSSMRRPEPNSL